MNQLASDPVTLRLALDRSDDPVTASTGLLTMFSHPFIVHALLAGTAVAVLSGLVGYFVVLRGQVFAGDALGHVAYTGALAALAFGMDLRLGLFVATIAAGGALGLLGGRGTADDVAIGTTFAWVLGLGVFFLAWYTTHASTGNGAASVNVLFGSIFGISAAAATQAVLIAAGLIALLLVIGRPLLFASLDPAVAAAAGIPVRLLGPVFLAIVGATAAEATQVIGALLLFGLLAAPAATAQRLTDRPWRAMWLSAAFAVTSVWAGVIVSYTTSSIPPSFAIMAVATCCYAATWPIGRLTNRSVQPGKAAPTDTPPGALPQPDPPPMPVPR